ncbi:MAG: GTPase HflX [Verrucomicrobiales bacterium]
MFDVRERPELVQRALLVAIFEDKAEEGEAADLLAELRELVGTLDIGIVGQVLNRVRERNIRFLTGSGKAREIIEQGQELQADCIIFDNELTPAQQRAWEAESGIAVIDRHEIILDIFDRRARTREARLQVDLARMEYSYPRLKRMWAHLDRQRGGGGAGSAGAARGEGEMQLEVDRRLARAKIGRLRAELDSVRQQRATQRKERSREALPHVAIVGYTNAGKSSLLNRLTAADVLVEDKLFATLDTTTRRFTLPDGQQALLTDTVGFIRKLPHDLVESFKATLEEAVLADFLIHVLDASHPRVYRFYETTLAVLSELGAGDRRSLVVLNKVDLITDAGWRAQLERHFKDAVFVSVKTGAGCDDLLHRLNELLYDRAIRLSLRVPQSRADLLSLIHREGKIITEHYEDNDVLVSAVIPKRMAHRFDGFRVNDPASPASSPLATDLRTLGRK